MKKTKHCPRCKKNKPFSFFHKNKNGDRKGKYGDYCIICKKQYMKAYKKIPWVNKLLTIEKRCAGRYRKRGIKNFLSIKDVKSLWFRDKAWLLKEPSIDRIDTLGNYTLDNCRFIELDENNRRPKRKHKEPMKPKESEG